MAFQNVNIGAGPNDGTGDPLYTAFNKVNTNFASIGSLGGTGQTFTATGGQTVFALSGGVVAANVIMVVVDGVVMIQTVDFTTSGSTITFLNGLLNGQTVYVR